MQNNLLRNLGLLLLRIAPSIMLLTHGISKFQKLIGGGEIKFGDPLGVGPVPSLILAIIGEVVCPLLLIIGFKTRWAAIPSALTMATAAFIVHASDPFGVKEKSLLFLSFFIVIILLGPGKYSVDGK